MSVFSYYSSISYKHKLERKQNSTSDMDQSSYCITQNIAITQLYRKGFKKIITQFKPLLKLKQHKINILYNTTFYFWHNLIRHQIMQCKKKSSFVK